MGCSSLRSELSQSVPMLAPQPGNSFTIIFLEGASIMGLSLRTTQGKFTLVGNLRVRKLATVSIYFAGTRLLYFTRERSSTSSINIPVYTTWMLHVHVLMLLPVALNKDNVVEQHPSKSYLLLRTYYML